MIELILSDRCTNCGACVEVCPTNVLDPTASGPPQLTRVEDCQTCFMCELYCRADAIYVAPDCDRRIAISPEEVIAAGCLGQYRKHSGWDEWAGRYQNNQWLMELVFRRAGETAALTASPPRQPQQSVASAADEGKRGQQIPTDAGL